MEWCSKTTVKSNVSQECVEYENFDYNVVSWYVSRMFFFNQDASRSVRCGIHLIDKWINQFLLAVNLLN